MGVALYLILVGQDLGKEELRPVFARTAEDVVGRAALDDLALVEVEHAAGDGFGEAHADALQGPEMAEPLVDVSAGDDRIVVGGGRRSGLG